MRRSDVSQHYATTQCASNELAHWPAATARPMHGTQRRSWSASSHLNCADGGAFFLVRAASNNVEEGHGTTRQHCVSIRLIMCRGWLKAGWRRSADRNGL